MSMRRGVTLIELIVTLVMLAVISGVTVLAIRRIDPPRPDDPRTIFADTLRGVLASGRPVVVHLLTDSGPASGVVRSDGSVVADSILDIDRMTGVPAHGR